VLRYLLVPRPDDLALTKRNLCYYVPMMRTMEQPSFHD
jgi:hypothetical protein